MKLRELKKVVLEWCNINLQILQTELQCSVIHRVVDAQIPHEYRFRLEPEGRIVSLDDLEPIYIKHKETPINPHQKRLF